MGELGSDQHHHTSLLRLYDMMGWIKIFEIMAQT